MVLGRKISVERVLRVCADNSVFRNNVNQCGVKISKFIYHYAPEYVDKQKYKIPWYRANFGFLDCQPHILISSGIVNIRFCAQNLSTKLMLLYWCIPCCLEIWLDIRTCIDIDKENEITHPVTNSPAYWNGGVWPPRTLRYGVACVVFATYLTSPFKHG